MAGWGGGGCIQAFVRASVLSLKSHFSNQIYDGKITAKCPPSKLVMILEKYNGILPL